MILEAFSKYLHQIKEKVDWSSIKCLDYWLFTILTTPVVDKTSKVIHKEIKMEWVDTHSFRFSSKSQSGDKLLQSLYNFATSYENFLFTRWLHEVKATDFKATDFDIPGNKNFD